MLIPNSKDQHEKDGDQSLHITKHILKYALRKADWNALLTLLITLL